MPETLTETELKEIEARAENATPPPWECGPSYRFIGAKNAPVMPFGGSAICNPNDNGGARLYPTNRKHNAEFMAHAREDIPALCRSLRAAWAENEALEQMNIRLTTGLVNIYHVITGEQCKHGVALGMATSAVSSLLDATAALRAQLAQVEKERDDLRKDNENLSGAIFNNEHASAMRDKCLEKVEEAVWLATKDFKGILNEVQRRAIALATATYVEAAVKIKSLTLDQEKQQS